MKGWDQMRMAETWNSSRFWSEGCKDYAIEIDQDKCTVALVRSGSQYGYRHLI